MDHTLSALEAPARRTVEGLMGVLRRLDGRGVGELFEPGGRFSGALSGGSFRGGQVIESHFIQVFKRLPRGPVKIERLLVDDGQITLDWCLEPEDPAFGRIPARYTLLLGPSGRIASLLAEWDAKILAGPPAALKA